MNKEAIESLMMSKLQYVDEGNGLSRLPNQQEVMDKVNDLIDRFNLLVGVIANANNTSK